MKKISKFIKKYWYKTNIHACVLCGAETKYRERVYNEDEKGTHWHNTACDIHFI